MAQEDRNNKAEVNADGLTEEDVRILEKLKAAAAAQAQIPARDRVPIKNPDKYASPLGIKDDGTLMDGSVAQKIYDNWGRPDFAAAPTATANSIQLSSAELCILYATLDLDVAPVVQSSELIDLETDALQTALVAGRSQLIARGLAHARDDGSLELDATLRKQVQILAQPKTLIGWMHAQQGEMAQRAQFALDGATVIANEMPNKATHLLSQYAATDFLAATLIQRSHIPALVTPARLPTFALPHRVLTAAMADPNSRLADIVTQLAAAGLDKTAAQGFVAAGLAPLQQTVLQAISPGSGQARLIMWFADNTTCWLIANLDQGGSIIVQQANATIIEQAIHRFIATVLA